MALTNKERSEDSNMGGNRQAVHRRLAALRLASRRRARTPTGVCSRDLLTWGAWGCVRDPPSPLEHLVASEVGSPNGGNQ